MNNHNKAFGRALRRLRQEANKSQEILGFEAGLDRTYISLLELGQRSPTLDTIMVLCTALNVSISNIAVAVEEEMKDLHG